MTTTRTDEPQERDIRQYLTVLGRYKYVIYLVVVAAVGTALLLASQRTPMYEATSELLLQRLTTEELLNPDAARPSNLQTIDTEVALLESGAMFDAVSETLGFAPDVTASVVGNSDVVTLTARRPDPESAALVANTYARTYVDNRQETVVEDLSAALGEVEARIIATEAELATVEAPLVALDDEIAGTTETLARERLESDRERLERRLESRIDSISRQLQFYVDERTQLALAVNLTQTGGAQVVNEAVPVDAPVGGGLVPTLIFAALVGVLLGVGLAFLLERLDDSIKNRDELQVASGLAVLAAIPRLGGKRKRSTVVAAVDPHSPATEAYRSLRTSLQFLRVDRAVQVVQVTSPSPGEGKTTTLSNLAVTLAMTGQRVIVVCFDLRRPSVHEFFGLPNDIGLTSVLVGDVPLEEALQQPEGIAGDLRVLTSGPIPPNPAELVGSQRSRDILEALRGRADVVLIDSPPVLPVTDALVLSSAADATILVALTARTRQRSVRRAVEALHQVGAPLAGAVLNGVPQNETPYGHYASRPAASSDIGAPTERVGQLAADVRRVKIDHAGGAGNGQGAHERPVDDRT